MFAKGNIVKQLSSNAKMLLSQPAFRFSGQLNQFYIPNKPEKVTFTPKDNKPKGLQKNHRGSAWNLDEITKSTEEHVVYTWGATDPARKSAMAIKKGEGVYLFDYSGNKYIDMTSQAINNNLGYGIPKPILDAITNQLQTLHHVYGGLTITEPKAKLA